VLTKQKLKLFKVVGGDVPLERPLTVMVGEREEAYSLTPRLRCTASPSSA
jgi:hypothetical protein